MSPPDPPPRHLAPPLRWPAAALLTLALGLANGQPGSSPGTMELFVPIGGLALALTLLWGRAMLLAIALGMVLASMLAGRIGTHALAEALSVVVMAGVASRLLERQPPGGERVSRLAALRPLVLWGGALGPACGVLTGHAFLWALGDFTPPGEGAGQHLAQAWMGLALGVVLVTPMALRLCDGERCDRRARWPEAAALWLLAMAACALIFGYIHLPWAAPLANAYWMFLFVGWSAIRLGLLPTAALLCLIAWLAQWATNQHIGYFAHDIAAVWGFGYWSYMAILGLFGLILTHYVADDRQHKESLRIAAATFEIGVPVLVTGHTGRVLQANAAFLKMSGLALPEVLARSPADFLAPDAANPPPAFFTPEATAEQRLVLRGPRRAQIPVWATATPVREQGQATTHYVIALPDITDFEAAQARQRNAEQAQREALVREVHHRIKNHLQGVVGMLRALEQRHPQLQEDIRQIAAQVQSIAVVYGLKGRHAGEALVLLDLLQAIVQGRRLNESIQVQCPDTATCQRLFLKRSEAVPVALVINELLTNAIKHASEGHQAIELALHCADEGPHAEIRISNPGDWHAPDAAAALPSGHGLELVRLLLPGRGARLSHETQGGRVIARLNLQTPVIYTRDDPPPDRA